MSPWRKCQKSWTWTAKNSQINTQQYVCPQGAGTEPPVRETITQSKREQRPHIFRSVVHALARTSFSGEKPSVEEKNFPSDSGFQSCLLPIHSKKQNILACYRQWTAKEICY